MHGIKQGYSVKKKEKKKKQKNSTPKVNWEQMCAPTQGSRIPVCQALY